MVINTVPAHRPIPAASLPNCPRFAVEPSPPEPSPLVSEPLKTEARAWCGSWQWSACDCWQWCGSLQWKDKCLKRCKRPIKRQRYQIHHGRETPTTNGKKWFSCWNWASSSETWKYGDSQRARLTRSVLGADYQDYSELLFRDITPEDYDLLLRLDESVRRRSASRKSVDALPRVQSKKVVGEVCTVCLEGFRLGDVVLSLPACKHNFHQECVSKWLLQCNRTCPLCNVEVFSSAI